MNRLPFTSFALSLSLLMLASACGGGEEEENNDYDAQLLAEYRAAIPAVNQLAAPAPQASTSAAVGDPALYPDASYDIVIGTNGAVSAIVDVMQTIVNQEPTLYDSDTREFFWGPVANDDGYGTVAAYIKDMGEGAQFRYHYALLRGVDNDVANLAPVIWGGATPNPDGNGHGVGVTLWDFEANYAFEQANNPDFDTLVLDRGRFAAAYGKGAGADGAFAFVVAVFRSFVPRDQPDNPPADLDYFYGRYDDGANTLDFVDWQATIDVDTQADRAAAENVSVRMAFLNEGTGRAEAEAWGGDLADNQTAQAVECWDTSLDQSYLSFQIYTDGTGETPYEDGDIASCGLFQASLTELGVPALEDVDPEVLAALDNVAQNGVPTE